MANDDYRDQHERDRAAGLAARHETRVERAIRRQVAEDIAQRLLAIADEIGDGEQRELVHDLAEVAREIGSPGEHSTQATEETE